MLGLWQIYPGRFAAEVPDWRETIERVSLNPGTIHDKGRVDPGIRHSDIGWLVKGNREHQKIISAVTACVRDANQALWAADLSGRAEWQVTRYVGGGPTAQKYDRHMDIHPNDGLASCRKLSVVVQLSDPGDYAGGNLHLDCCRNPDESELRQAGTAIVFPSFLVHSISPLLRGTRWSLVSWHSGPNWR